MNWLYFKFYTVYCTLDLCIVILQPYACTCSRVVGSCACAAQPCACSGATGTFRVPCVCSEAAVHTYQVLRSTAVTYKRA